MSSDDRDRMMQSRALPDQFPILQTLQPLHSSSLMSHHRSTSRLYSPDHRLSLPGTHSYPHSNDGDYSAVSSQRSSYNSVGFNSPVESEQGMPLTGERVHSTYTTTSNPFHRSSHYIPRNNVEGMREIGLNIGTPRTFSDRTESSLQHNQFQHDSRTSETSLRITSAITSSPRNMANLLSAPLSLPSSQINRT